MADPAPTPHVNGPLTIDILGLPIDVFWIGVIGSLAVDLVAIAAIYESEAKFPEKYRRWGFYLVRGLIALTGGVLVPAAGRRCVPVRIACRESGPSC